VIANLSNGAWQQMRRNARTISEIAPTGSNSFGVVRLLAATLVVFSHATGIVHGDAVKEPLAVFTGHTLGSSVCRAF